MSDDLFNPSPEVTSPIGDLLAPLPYYTIGIQARQGRIDEIHPKLAASHYHARRIRDTLSGERAIKARGRAYLPNSRANQHPDEYNLIKFHTNWFPATSRTAAGMKGLMFAKNVVLNAPVLEPIKNVITRELGSVRDLAEQTVRETLATNFTGLLTDHPDAPQGVNLNAANALQLGFRPFSTLYPLESFIWIDYGYQDNARKPVRVVLREDDDRILELTLTRGIYEQHVWQSTNGQWSKVESRVPRWDGQPLNRLPFVIVSDNTNPWPQESVLTDVSNLNLAHYLQSSKIANLELMGAGLVAWISGIDIPKDKDGKKLPVEIDFSTGGFILLEKENAKTGFLEPQGHLAEQLNKTLETIQDQMAKCGARVIASEKVAPEAAETVARRAASEDATNASLALVYQRKLSDHLSWHSWWMDGSTAQFTLNTDYRNHTMSAQERTVALAELQSGKRSFQDWWMERRDNGIINNSDSLDEERQRIAQDLADAPPIDTGL